MQGGETMLPYIIACSAEKPKAAPMVISNDEVLQPTDKVQSLSKKSAEPPGEYFIPDELY
jgi:hypothetical protein